MAIFFNSVRGILSGNIPVVDIEVVFDSADIGVWTGSISPTSYFTAYENRTSSKIYGANSGNIYITAGSGNITKSDYQLMMREVEAQTSGELFRASCFDNLAKILWEIKFSGGYLTYYTDGSGSVYTITCQKQLSIPEIKDALQNGRQGVKVMFASAPEDMKCCFFREYFKRTDLTVYRFGGIYPYSSEYKTFTDACIAMPFNLADLNVGEPEIIEIEFDDEFGTISGGGGYGGGSFDGSSDAFGVPSLPTVSVVNTGFINVYNPTSSELSGFADDLFPNWASADYDNGGDLKAIANNITALAKNFGSFIDSFINKNLIDYVIDCHIVPVVPSTAENTGLKVGFKTFNYNPAKVTSDYVEVDCGTLYIKEYYNNFLDYHGTKAKLYLPCVGFVGLKPEWFQGGAIKVVYHFNVIDGSCVAYVLATSSKSELTETVVGTFGGNCCLHIPITGVNYSSMISGYIGNGASAMANLSMGNMGGALSSSMQAISSKPDMQQSNGFSGGSSFMGVRIPYILIERPVASFSKNYPSECGLPYNVTSKIGKMQGFTVCENLHTDNIDCTKTEKDMIASLFKSGVII